MPTLSLIVVLVCKSHGESIGYLFVSCEYTSGLWNKILPLGWSAAHSINMPLFLASTLIGHPFKNEKRCIWLHFIQALLWIVWSEGNRRIFHDKGLSLRHSFKAIVFWVISWCKCSPFFHHYSFTSLLSNWRAFL